MNEFFTHIFSMFILDLFGMYISFFLSLVIYAFITSQQRNNSATYASCHIEEGFIMFI
ncbi:hypothetical protein Hanom_Chr04g00333061 [Helianthus anomalus]